MLPASRTLAIDSEAIPRHLGRPALEPVRLSGSEGVNSLFTYELLLKTPEALDAGASAAADFDLDSFIGREIRCSIELDGAGRFVPGALGESADAIGAGTRQINALITAASLWGEEGRHLQYKLTLRPWLHLATLSTDCKIFQNQSVVEILGELLADYPFPVEQRLIEEYPQRDYQTQFNETDFDFFCRLTQENGISYHFEHSEGKHRLVLTDAAGVFAPNPSEAYRQVDYHPPGWKTDAEYLHSFVPEHQLTSGQYATREYDYTRPRADLSASHRDPRPTGQAGQEVYQWHHRLAGAHYAQPRAGAAEANDPHTEGRDFARIRMQALRTHASRARASGNLRAMVPGCTFELVRHPRQSANAQYLVLHTELLIEDVGQSSQIKDAAPARKQHWRVQVDLTAHPLTEPLRPALTQPKPRNAGVQTALVVGPAGQNLWTDELGRIKVQFPWDRLGQCNQHSTCWLRVASPWAGNQLGAIHIPRIGQEVLVDFIAGDTDLPIVTGRVHNQVNLPPWSLPSQSALSGIRSRELAPEGGNSAAGRSNHLVLDDTAESIQAQLKSDHQHSVLSLGHITRIEDNAGRKDARGEGFELRTDGHGSLRTAKGLLLSTDGRSQAVGGMLSRDELIACLEHALSLAKTFDKTAVECHGAPRETKPQQDLSQAVVALGHGAAAERELVGVAAGGQPVLAMSGAAGIASGTPRDHTQYAGQNIDTVAGRNQQHYAGRSILQSASRDIEQFAVHGEIRSIANRGKIIQQAQHNGVEVTGERDITITSTKEGVVVRGKKSIVLATGDGSYLRIGDGQVVFGTRGSFTVKSATSAFAGPSTLSMDVQDFPTASFNDRFIVRDELGNPLAHMRYRLTNPDGGELQGVTGPDGMITLQQSVGPDGVQIELLGLARQRHPNE